MKTLSIMLHHDAITGTHMNEVGKNYKSMMTETSKNALKKPDTNNFGALYELVATDAINHGIGPTEMTECSLEGLTVTCSGLTSKKSHIISLYNPNLEPVNGLFLRLKRELLGLKVTKLKADLPKGTVLNLSKLEAIVTEAFCIDKVSTKIHHA